MGDSLAASSASSVDDNESEAIISAQGRRRRRNSEGWDRNKKKRAKVAGTETSTHKRKNKPPETVPPRVLTKNFDCRCKCAEKFTDQQKERLFKQYNEFASWSEQTLYLQRLCRPQPVRQRRKRLQYGGKERDATFAYYFEIKRNGKTVSTKVCQKAFLLILGIPKSRLRWKVQNRRDESGDKRGTHANRPNRTPAEALEKVRNFIKRLPARESHYSRTMQRRRKYLDASMEISGLHKEFLKENADLAGTKDDHSDAVIKYSRFHEIFTMEFNIGIGYPRSDLCDVCERLNSRMKSAQLMGDNASEKTAKENIELHQRRAESFYNKMKEIKAAIKDDTTAAAICFDFEKNLPLCFGYALVYAFCHPDRKHNHSKEAEK